MNSKHSGRTSALLRLTIFACISICFLCLLFSWLGFASSAGEFGRKFRRTVSTTTGFCLTCKLNEIDPKLPFVKALETGTIEQDLIARATSYGQANGIQILFQGSEFEYTLYARGERIVLFKTAATVEGLAQADALLTAAIDKKIEQLTNGPHQAAFSVSNEYVDKQSALMNGKLTVGDHAVMARRPRLNELYGIEAALNASLPSNLAPGEGGVKFYFLQEQLYKDSKDAAAYYVYKDKDKRAAIYITPGSLDNLWPTEADAPEWAVKQRMQKSGVFYDTIESLLMHELGHNHQSRMGWDDDEKKLSAMSTAAGFVTIKEEGTNRFLIKVKVDNSATDGNGSGSEFSKGSIELYRLESGLNHSSGKHWFRVNQNGQLLTENGLPAATADAAKMLSNEQVKAAALVTPATNYFDTPLEVEAEAIKLYRMGGPFRAMLLQRAALIYRLVEAEDQAEIDQRFGSVLVKEERSFVATTTSNNPSALTVSVDHATQIKTREYLEPVYIRAWNGQLVPFTAAAARELLVQEITALKQAGDT